MAVIPAIHQNIRPRSIAARIARQIQIRPLQLLRLPLPPHRNLIAPHILDIGLDEIANLRRHIPRTHRIHPRKPHPLHRQRPAHVDHARLGRIVRGLQLRDVDDVRAHGGSGDERAVAEAGDVVGGLLGFEDLAGGAGAVEGAVEVGGDDFAVVVEGAFGQGALLPGDARVGDEDVEPVVEFGDLRADGGVDGVGVGDVDGVGSAWQCRLVRKRSRCLYGMRCGRRIGVREVVQKRLTLDTVLLLNLGRPLNGFLVVVVPDSHIGPGFSQSMGYNQADASSGAGDNGSAALQREQRKHALLGRRNGVVVQKHAILGWFTHFEKRLAGRKAIRSFRDGEYGQIALRLCG